MSNIAFWGFAAAIPAVLLEYLYRTLSNSWFYNLYIYIPLSLFISYGIYRIVTEPGTSLIEAFIVWTFSTTILRLLLSLFVLGDTITIGTWADLGLMVAARISQAFWR